MHKTIRNAYEITDAKISFVSLVDKAANKRQFLITKAENGKANFTSTGRIVKTDSATHHITGIVYEPLVEDSHGNYMTEAEITKAAYWFAKHGDQVDLQHSFEPMSNATVVETWIAKADFQIGDEVVKQGTWLMTVEVTDTAVWEAIQKGDITGFSMGGVGKYSEEDTDLETVQKNNTPPAGAEKRGLLAKLAEALGLRVVEKGEMAEIYEVRSRGNLFWNAMSTLEDCLYHYDPISGNYVFEKDEQKVREVLSDFTAIVDDLLTNEHSITKALADGAPVHKSHPNPNKNKEEHEVTKTEVESIVQAAISKALNPTPAAPAAPAAEPVEKAVETTPAAAPAAAPAAPAAEAPITKESIEQMVTAAIQKAMPAPAEAPATAVDVLNIVEQAVAKALEPVLKSRGLPTNLNGEPAPVEKSNVHYLHGIL